MYCSLNIIIPTMPFSLSVSLSSLSALSLSYPIKYVDTSAHHWSRSSDFMLPERSYNR